MFLHRENGVEFVHSRTGSSEWDFVRTLLRVLSMRACLYVDVLTSLQKEKPYGVDDEDRYGMKIDNGKPLSNKSS